MSICSIQPTPSVEPCSIADALRKCVEELQVLVGFEVCKVELVVDVGKRMRCLLRRPEVLASEFASDSRAS